MKIQTNVRAGKGGVKTVGGGGGGGGTSGRDPLKPPSDDTPDVPEVEDYYPPVSRCVGI